jgi:hypothetical protein
MLGQEVVRSVSITTIIITTIIITVIMDTIIVAASEEEPDR